MNHLNRDIGLIGLTFVAVGGIIGSGWLFAPFNAASSAGPASLIAWLIGAVAMLLLALTFAEISAILPVAGGIATVPYLSHGTTTSMIIGWTAWIGYNSTAPIEVEAMLRYLDVVVPWLYEEGLDNRLTLAGHVAAAFLLVLFVILNAFGVRLFARINSTITWAKIAIPLVISGVLIYSQFTVENFTEYGGFAPEGFDGIAAAITTGGVIFSMIGFRHAIDLAGEVKNPRVTIPLALVLSIVICFVIYALLQVAFIGALLPTDLKDGWTNITFDSQLGPMGAIAAAAGILWLVSLINAGAVISPFGGALVSTGSNARLALALSYNGFLPAMFQRLSSAGVPLRALLLNFVIGALFLFLLPFKEILALNGAAIVMSFAIGPVAVRVLRDLAPDIPRSFRLPFVEILAGAAFVVATLIVFWSGWDTVWRLGVAILIGLIFMAFRLRKLPPDQRDIRPAIWIAPFFAGILLLSAFSPFGGTGDLPHGVVGVLVGIFGMIMYVVAVKLSLGPTRFAIVLKEVQRELAEEEGKTT